MPVSKSMTICCFIIATSLIILYRYSLNYLLHRKVSSFYHLKVGFQNLFVAFLLFLKGGMLIIDLKSNYFQPLTLKKECDDEVT